MNILKYILFFVFPPILIGGISGCTGSSKVIHSSSQVWYGGAAGSGGGINYEIRIKKELRVSFKVLSVWVGDRKKGRLFEEISLVPLDQGQPYPDSGVPKGVEAFDIQFSGYNAFRGHQNPDRPQSKDRPPVIDAPTGLPPKFTEGALVRLKTGNKETYLIVSSFEKLEPIALP